MKTTGQLIKARREYLGMSQDELAKKVGYKTRSAVNKIETMTGREVKPSMLKKFAQALECSMPYLMGWEEEEPETIADIMADSEVMNIAMMYARLNHTNRDFIRSTVEMLIKKQEDA